MTGSGNSAVRSDLVRRLAAYPPQEPLSPVGTAYAQRILALGQGCEGADFSYGPDPYQSLTLFQPARPTGMVLVFFHGGGWTSGYKEWMYFMAPALMEHGITFVSAGYRLAPQHVFPTGLDDCADALAWVLRHIGGHGGNPARVFVGGHSAGGHYAALLAVSGAWRSTRGLPTHALRGCLPVCGVYRFGADSGMAVRPRFLGPPDAGQAEIGASPLKQLQPAVCPPFLLSVGERDFPHLIAQAEQMAAALRSQAIAVQIQALKASDHFQASIACGDPTSGWPGLAAAWMRKVCAQDSPLDGTAGARI